MLAGWQPSMPPARWSCSRCEAFKRRRSNPAAQFGAAIVSTGPQVVRTQVGSRLSDQWPVFWRARFWREVDRDADG